MQKKSRTSQKKSSPLKKASSTLNSIDRCENHVCKKIEKKIRANFKKNKEIKKLSHLVHKISKNSCMRRVVNRARKKGIKKGEMREFTYEYVEKKHIFIM